MHFAQLLAFAGTVSAVNYATSIQHNGLLTFWNEIIKEHGPAVDYINDYSDSPGITAFVPVNSAVGTWEKLPSTISESYVATNDTILYNIIVGSYTIKDLSMKNGQIVPTLLQGQNVKIYVEGVQPDFTIVIGSGTDYKTNSTIGLYNTDFVLDNGYIQTSGTVFELPTQALSAANQQTSKNSAPSESLGSASLLSVLAMGFAMW